MKPIHAVYGVSVALHVVGAIALNRLEPARQEDVIAISMTTVEQEKKEEKPKEEPKPEPEARPTPKAAPTKSEPEPEAAPEPAPDFGFVLSGGGGPGGVAVGPAAPKVEPKTVTRKVLAAAVPAATAECQDPEVKAKATSMPHPTYTDEARAAAIEGKVRVQLTVGVDGNVLAATIVEGLGHGLDEAAIAALKEAKFTPASRCGTAVESTFTVSVRFAL